MTITINSSFSTLAAQRHLNESTKLLNLSVEKMSSGNRINSAGDDAAGLQISNRLESQMTGLEVSTDNANHGISVMQTAEGAMQETTSILQRMRDLSLQAANGVNSQGDRQALQEEMGALNDELNRVAETTSFAGKKLINGTFGKTSFQLDTESGQAMQIGLKSMRSDTMAMGGLSYKSQEMADSHWRVEPGRNQFSISFLNKDGRQESIDIEAKQDDDIEQVATYINGQTDKVSASVNEKGQLQIYMAGKETSGTLSFSGGLADALQMSFSGYESVNDLDITSVGGAQRSVAVLDTALEYVDNHRAELGAWQNRLGHTISNLNNVNKNISDSNRRIKDTDYAKEAAKMVKQQMLQQAGTSVLAQAKSQSGLAVSLLGG